MFIYLIPPTKQKLDSIQIICKDSTRLYLFLFIATFSRNVTKTHTPFLFVGYLLRKDDEGNLKQILFWKIIKISLKIIINNTL